MTGPQAIYAAIRRVFPDADIVIDVSNGTYAVEVRSKLLRRRRHEDWTPAVYECLERLPLELIAKISSIVCPE